MSFTIGTVKIETELALGPMAGITDLPFRFLCREQGAGLLYTEMVSAKGVLYRNRNTAELLRTTEEEHPIALQLFGEDPEIMGKEAALLSELPFDFLDVNMGCPVPKVVNNGEGSALMQRPERIFEIVNAMVKAQPKPVLVKLRKGFLTENAAECAKAAEDAGASAVCVHGRLRGEYYAGHSDWGAVRRVKEALRIPVIGSGDVMNGKDAVRMKAETGCDCVMIARAARGNPWIFKECKTALEAYARGELQPEDGRSPESEAENTAGKSRKFSGEMTKPPEEEVISMILRHARLQIDSWRGALLSEDEQERLYRVLGVTREELSEERAEELAMREMRKHVAWYLAGYPNSAKLRSMTNELGNYAELERMLREFGK